MICIFVSAYAKVWFSHNEAQIRKKRKIDCCCEQVTLEQVNLYTVYNFCSYYVAMKSTTELMLIVIKIYVSLNKK